MTRQIPATPPPSISRPPSSLHDERQQSLDRLENDLMLLANSHPAPCNLRAQGLLAYEAAFSAHSWRATGIRQQYSTVFFTYCPSLSDPTLPPTATRAVPESRRSS